MTILEARGGVAGNALVPALERGEAFEALACSVTRGQSVRALLPEDGGWRRTADTRDVESLEATVGGHDEVVLDLRGCESACAEKRRSRELAHWLLGVEATEPMLHEKGGVVHEYFLARGQH